MEEIIKMLEDYRFVLRLIWETHYIYINATRDEIERGEKIEVKSESGNTAVHIACFDAFNPDCLQILLRCKPNLNIQNELLQTPLHFYMKRLYIEPAMLESLLKSGADPNIPDAEENTSLHYLTEHLLEEIVEMKLLTDVLLKYNAKVNIRNKYGNTPLHCAVHHGNVGFITSVLHTEASVLIKNNQNFTAMDLAYTNRNDQPKVFIEIAKFAIILNHSGISVNRVFLDEIQSDESLQIFNEQCNEELSILSNTKLGNTNVTLTVILESSTYAIAKFLRNYEILEWFQNFESGQYKIFGNRLNQQFKDGLARKKAEDFGYIFFRKLRPSLPELCVKEVVSYLNNEDLYNVSPSVV